MFAVLRLVDQVLDCMEDGHDQSGDNNNSGHNDGDTKNNIISTIAIMYAMVDEAKPCISALNLSLDDAFSAHFRFPVYSNSNNKKKNIDGQRSIFLICNGKCPAYKCDRVGTQWASVCAFQVLSRIKPDLIINAGTCGGITPKHAFKQQANENENEAAEEAQDSASLEWPEHGLDLNIADVFIGSRVIYSDRQIPIPQWQPWDIGNYALFGHEYLCSKLKIESAVISTSNAFAFSAEELKLYKKHKVLCKEMECAAIAEMCLEFNATKLIAIKGVTDIIGCHSGSDFLANLAKTVKAVAEVVVQTVHIIEGKTIAEIVAAEAPK